MYITHGSDPAGKDEPADETNHSAPVYESVPQSASALPQAGLLAADPLSEVLDSIRDLVLREFVDKVSFRLYLLTGTDNMHLQTPYLTLMVGFPRKAPWFLLLGISLQRSDGTVHSFPFGYLLTPLSPTAGDMWCHVNRFFPNGLGEVSTSKILDLPRS